MADVRITYSRDKAAAAARLEEAISAAGFYVRSDEIGDLEDLFAADHGHESGAATLLIWSRPLLSSAQRSGLLRQVRKERNLIEVSADGVGPQAPEGDSRVIMISGWRGQPFHPGWQRIASDLERMCGPRKDAPEVAARVEPPAPRQAALDDVPGKAERGRLPVGRLGLAVLAAAGLFGAGFGAATWMDNRASGPEAPRPVPPEVTEPQPAVPASKPALAAPVKQPSPPKSDLDVPVSQQSVDEANQTAASPKEAPAASASPSRSREASRKAAKQSVSGGSKAGSPKRSEATPYSRKNSKIMRLFCEGSGRSTPQCKTFLRSTRGSRR